MDLGMWRDRGLRMFRHKRIGVDVDLFGVNGVVQSYGIAMAFMECGILKIDNTGNALLGE
jgi:hypothetical protein